MQPTVRENDIQCWSQVQSFTCRSQKWARFSGGTGRLTDDFEVADGRNVCFMCSDCLKSRLAVAK